MQPLHITFDGPPLQPAGTATLMQRYDEPITNGISFKPIDAGSTFTRVGPGGPSGQAENGTSYLRAAFTQSLMFSFTNGLLFDLIAIDLAEYSTAFAQPIIVHFVGYRFDGSTVSADLVTDGVIDGTGPLADFQTFTFGPEFTGLTRVEIPTWAWSLDNLNVRIPEPSPSLLLLAGGLLFGALRFSKRVVRHH